MDPVSLAPPMLTPPVVPLPEPKSKIWVWVLAGVLLLGIGIVTGVLLGQQFYPLPNTQPTLTPPHTNLPATSATPAITLTNQEICEQNSGTWLKEFQECEHIPQPLCEKLGGTFKECASPCRHDPAADRCITLCVRVCELN